MKTETETPAIKVWRVVCVYSHFSLLLTESFLTLEGAEYCAKEKVMDNGIHCLILETVALVKPKEIKRDPKDQYQTSLRV